MTVRQYHPDLSPEAYLEAEQDSPIKHEYIQGQIYAMAGASDAHVTITANVVALLRNHIRLTGCRLYVTDMKARIESLNIFYPIFRTTNILQPIFQRRKWITRLLIENRINNFCSMELSLSIL